MTWTSPRTFTANSSLTAADLNVYLRDNMLETEAGVAATKGSFMVVDGQNSVAERAVASAYIPTAETRTVTTSFGNLATAGPAVTLITGTQAIVWLYAQIKHSVASGRANMSFAVSNSSSIAADDSTSLYILGTNPQRLGGVFPVTGLSPGANTFTAQYRPTEAGTGTWADRRIVVLPL